MNKVAHGRVVIAVMSAALATALAGCGSGGGGGGGGVATTTYTVGGETTGLTGTGLVLQLNDAGDMAVSAPGGSFAFPALSDGSAYTVTVRTQPSRPEQTCTVANGSGTLAGANITNVAITCAVQTYTVGGTVAGLTGSGLVLTLNGGSGLAISGNNPFTFPALANGSSYTVAIDTQPANQECTVANGSGTLAGGNVSNVAVTCAAPWSGTQHLGVSGASTFGYATAVDINGNVLVAGKLSGTTAGVDGQAMPPNTNNAVLVTRYSPSGSRQFTRLLGADGATVEAKGVTCDSGGNFYVAGSTDRKVSTVDTEVLVGIKDLFLAKYGADGSLVYVHQWGVVGATSVANAVTADAVGNVYVAGYIQRPLGVRVLAVAKFDASGARVWVQELGAQGGLMADASGVAVHGTHVYVVGRTLGALPSGLPTPNVQTGFSDYFLAKYDGDGNLVYARQFGATGGSDSAASAVAVNADGDIYVAGSTDHSLGMSGPSLQTGSADLFVTRFTADGTRSAVWQYGVGSKVTFGNAITVDKDGNVIVGGYTNGAMETVGWSVLQDAYVAKFTPTGTKLYAHQVGVAALDTYGYGVATDNSGNAFLAGYTRGNIDNITRTGTSDLFVTKYNAAGVKQ